MAYLIDGHNLIPKVPGLSLQSLDDELQLIALLEAFAKANRRKVEVYFDRAPTGKAGARHFGMVKAHFVHETGSADSAIAAHLRRLKREARNWTVVSSDRQVTAEARAQGARVISSEEFARQLTEKAPGSGKPQDPSLSSQEVDEWLRVFGSGHGKKLDKKGRNS